MHSGCSTMEVNLAPITLINPCWKLALPMVGAQATGLYTPSLASTTWQDKWKQYPHKTNGVDYMLCLHYTLCLMQLSVVRNLILVEFLD
jgi:hypothetical protein